MMKMPIGLIIKSIVEEKRFKVVELANKMGLSKQSIYQAYSKLQMSSSELSRWASVLDVPAEKILEMRDNALANEGSVNNQSGDYLLNHLTKLEESFKENLDRIMAQIEIKDRQIEVKDRQIEGLQKTVDVLLGKSRDVSILMATLAAPSQSKSSAAMA